MNTFSQKKTFVNKYDEIAKKNSTGVHPEMVDFVPREGRTKVFTGSLVPPGRDGERSIGTRDAISRWTLSSLTLHVLFG
jgi:hypothetical protein